ncbi:MAG: hypothetical protein NWS61_06185, partial [Schleiferiaceae bacterium]|nr:hypothetical protein [Schleiferiaceae bacterium]
MYTSDEVFKTLTTEGYDGFTGVFTLSSVPALLTDTTFPLEFPKKTMFSLAVELKPFPMIVTSVPAGPFNGATEEILWACIALLNSTNIK